MMKTGNYASGWAFCKRAQEDDSWIHSKRCHGAKETFRVGLKNKQKEMAGNRTA